MTLDLHTLPVISTSHLTQEVADQLTEQGNGNPWCPCASWEYGFFLHLDDLEAREVDGVTVPQCLIDVRNWMRKKNLSCINGDLKTRADWVRFDRDYDAVGDLPVYDW